MIIADYEKQTFVISSFSIALYINTTSHKIEFVFIYGKKSIICHLFFYINGSRLLHPQILPVHTEE